MTNLPRLRVHTGGSIAAALAVSVGIAVAGCQPASDDGNWPPDTGDCEYFCGDDMLDPIQDEAGSGP